MFNIAKRIFRSQSSQAKNQVASNLKDVFDFEQKLNQIPELSSNDQITTFLLLSANFINTFNSFDSTQIKSEQIFPTYQKYLKYVIDFAEIIFDEKNGGYEYLFKNLKLVGHQLGYIPDSVKFVQFFYLILRTAKNGDIQCLKSSSSFALFLFKNEDFFREFSIEMDGLTSIFTSFFVTNNKEAMDFLMELLFTIVPSEFYKIPSQTTLAVCKDSMNSDNCPECALFLCNYLGLLSVNCPEDVTESFYNEDGFTCLNHFLVTSNDKTIMRKCYEILLFKKGKPTKSSLRSLYEIYSVIPDYQEIALNILDSLQVEDIQRLIPIHFWVLKEESMKEETVLMIFALMMKIGITNYVANIFTIIDKCPTYKKYFLELIYVSLNEKGLDPENLIEPRKINYPKSTNSKICNDSKNSFLTHFVFRVTKEQLKESLLDDSKYFREILISAYSCPKSAKVREEALSKIIHAYDTDKLTDFMIRIISIDITSEMFILLLSNLLNQYVCNLFIYVLENHLCAFEYEYFISQSGLSSFNVILEDKKDKENVTFFIHSIIKIIGLMTKNGPRHEIDEWILNLPNDSILFNEEYHEMLAKTAVNEKTLFLNVPSLLFFVVLVYKKNDQKGLFFDLTSPICLYNAGKYGIPMFLQRDMKIVDSVPYYNVIVNRYINPTIYNEIADDFDHYPSFVNSVDVDQFNHKVKLPNFELFELYFSGNDDSDPSITFKDIDKNGSALNPIRTVDFRFFVPSKFKEPRVSVFRSDNMDIEYFKGILSFKTSYKSDSANIIINKENIFVHVKLLFNQGKVFIKAFVEPIDQNEKHDYVVKPYEKTLDIDPNPLFTVTFGGRYSSAKTDLDLNENELSSYRLIFDRFIFINNRLALLENTNDAAFKVPYSSFYSYIMKDRARIESMFLKLEEHQNTPQFTPIYNSILLMIKYLKQDIIDNSPSNNSISFQLYITESNSNACTGFSDVISKEYLFSRLLYSLKRSVSSISSNILVYLHQLPYTFLDEEDFADFTYITLIDFEIYFLFDKQLITSYLNLVKNDISDSSLLVNKLIEYKTTSFLISIIKRSDEYLHISDEILSLICTILINIGSDQNACLYKFINEAVIVSYWKFHFMIETFSVQSIMELQQVESPLQVSFLNTVKNVLTTLKEPKFVNHILVEYSLFFNDERSLIFFEVIAHYSYFITNYIDPDKCPYISYSFARFADNEKAWLIAFTILGGLPKLLTEFPNSLHIRIPKFAPTILIMLIRLLSLQASSIFNGDDQIKHKELVEKVFSSLMAIPLNDFAYFATDMKLISLLSNFGVIPSSVLLSFDSSDRTPIKLNYEPIKMSSIDFSSYKDHDFFKDKELLKLSIDCFKLPTFADDLVNNEWVNSLDLTRLISFITKIILSTDFNNFAQIAVGNALMYTPYQKLFAKEIIFSILTHYQNMAKTEAFLRKSVNNFMSVVSIAARCSVFSDCYLKFLDKVIAFLKTWCFPKIQDQSFYSKELRDVILYSITFIDDENEVQERNKLLIANKDLIFNQQMNENMDYALIVNFYILSPPKDAQRQSITTTIVEKFSQIESLIIKHFRINEFSSYSNISLSFSPFSSSNSLSTPISISSIPNSGSIRVSNAKKILEWAESFLRNSSRVTLFVSSMKAAYVHQSTLCQFDHIQVYCRVLEQKLYRCIKDEYLYKQNYLPFTQSKNDENANKYEIKSYYLSQVTESYYSPRNVAPSPFAIQSPPIDEKVTDIGIYMPNKNVDIKSKIEYVDFFGQLMFPYQWCQDLSIFKHSYVFTPEGTNNENNFFFDISNLFDPKTNAFKYTTSNSAKEVKKTILRDFLRIFGTFNYCFEVDLLYYVHNIPSLLFVQDDKIILLILSTKKNFLIKYYEHHLLLIPLNQEVLLNEFHNSTIFCGHYALTFHDKRFVRYDEHYYSHEKRSLSLFYNGDPNIIILFKTTKELEMFVSKKFNVITKNSNNGAIYNNSNFYGNDPNSYNLNIPINNFNLNRFKQNKKQNNNNNVYYNYVQSLPSNSFFLISTPAKEVILFWLEHKIPSFDYLVYLNMLGSRSFVDLSQYPVFPWVCVPFKKTLRLRDLSLPMGQLSNTRTKHFDDTYANLEDGYFYGCHYSNPGIVLWYLMRIPPFNFFTWDLNNGWDAQTRMFRSITAAYLSASTINPADVKELIPEIYSVPMSLTNNSHLNCKPGNVNLPTTNDESEISSALFVGMNRKFLEESPNLNKWIDLIFGYKQTGPEALKSKNIFLPTSYHTSTPESSSMDKEVFEDHVNNFGQCPKQIFRSCMHPSRTERVTKTAEEFAKSLQVQVPYSTWCFYQMFFILNKKNESRNNSSSSSENKTSSPGSLKKRLLRSMSFKSTIPKILNTEPSISYSFYLSLTAANSSNQIFDPYFLRSGIDECTRFIHFMTNEKKDGMSVASGSIEIRWKLVNTAGLIVPIQSIPIIPNGMEKYIDKKLIEIPPNDYYSFLPFSIPFISSQPSQTVDSLQNSCFVVNYENEEVITIRKINNSNNSNVPQIFNSTSAENKANIQSSMFNSTSELMAVFKDNDGSYINHISVSENGAYIVASYDDGLVKVLRIDFDKMAPQRIRLVSTFSQNSEVLLSKLSTRDMLVFSVTNSGKLVFWSFATGMKHREFDLGINKKSIIHGNNHKSMDNICTRRCEVIDIINDDFDGLVTVLLTNKILQFATNGTALLRKFVINENDIFFTSIALYPLDFSFDKRILVVGDSIGSLHFFAVTVPDIGEYDSSEIVLNNEDFIANNENNKEFENHEIDESKVNNGELVAVAVHKGVLKAAVSSIFVDKEAQAIVANDQRGGSVIVKMDSFLVFNKIERCEQCLNEKTEHCKHCEKPICPVCATFGLCDTCKENSVNFY